jgi:hypothetical protein
MTVGAWRSLVFVALPFVAAAVLVGVLSLVVTGSA